MRDNKKLIAVAVAIGILTVILVLLYGKSQSDKIAQITRDQVEVAKAAQDLKSGDILNKESFYTERVPRQYLPPNPIEASELEMYLGVPIAVNVAKGGMLLTSDFISAADHRGLSFKVPPSERAYTIAVDEISGVANLLSPGDRVDILATFPVTEESAIVDSAESKQKGYLTVPMLQNVTLLAVGMRTENTNFEGGGPYEYTNVTMSVTIDEAELLTIAQMRGKLTLLLRNEDDFENATITKKTLREVLEDLEVIQKERTKRIVVEKPKRKPQPKRIEILQGG